MEFFDANLTQISILQNTMHCINTYIGIGSGGESSTSAGTITGIQERSYSYFLSKRPVLFLRLLPNCNGCYFGYDNHLIPIILTRTFLQ